MRKSRLKAPREWDRAYYHCVSRIVDQRFIFGDEEKTEFLRLMRFYEKLCQVRILTYCLMSNHFHLLVEVPSRPAESMREETLFHLIRCCYGRTLANQVRAQVLQSRQARAFEAAQKILESWFSRMWDISTFMKTLKQRFTQWYNKREGRKGTLWESRFRSTILQDGPALWMVGTYIDLNPVRAKLVSDPKDYRWSGYGAACAGVGKAFQGLTRIMGSASCPQKILSDYRVMLYVAGDTGDEHARRLQSELGSNSKAKRSGFDHAEVDEVHRKQGELSAADLLRCRVRYFIDGGVIGSRSFVDSIFDYHRDHFGAHRKSGARRMRGGDFGELYSLRDLKHQVIDPSEPK